MFKEVMKMIARKTCKHEGKLIHVRNYYGDRINELPRLTRSTWKCPKCGNIVYRDYFSNDIIYVPEEGIGEVSDGYHTFNELYHHRAILFSVICNSRPDIAWKSKKHHDGSMYDNMFIVGINTPEGQATYHYDVNPYWDIFNVKEVPFAPMWDGHTPEDAIRRIELLGGISI